MIAQLINAIDIVFEILYLALMIRIFLSWIPHNPHQPIISVIYQISEPILAPFRNIVPSYRFGIDLSPIFAFLALYIGKDIIIRLLVVLLRLLGLY